MAISRTCAGLFHARAVLLVVLSVLSFPVSAEDGTQSGALKLELNRADATSGGCRLSFLAVNQTGQTLTAPSYELVFFSPAGVIDQLTVFDFGPMPEGKTVVRQFEVPGVSCEAGRILVNGPAGCDAGDPAHCRIALDLASRTPLSFDQ